MICTICNIDKMPEDYYYIKGKLNGRRCKKCRIKQNSTYSRKVYKRKTKQQREETQDEKDDLVFKQNILKKLFPTGFIPDKFKNRYL